jgi:hypothetical protein
MARWNSTLSVLAIFMAVMVIYLFFQMGWANTLNLESGIGASLIAVFPGLFVTILGFVTIGSQFRSPLVVGGFGAVGIGLAVLFGEMYDANIIDSTLLAGATMAQLEVITIIVSLLMGGVAYASRGR